MKSMLSVSMTSVVDEQCLNYADLLYSEIPDSPFISYHGDDIAWRQLPLATRVNLLMLIT